MLAGKPPFNGEDENVIQGKIKTGAFKTRQRDFKHVSEEAVAFLKRLMTSDQEQRPTAEDAL